MTDIATGSAASPDGRNQRRDRNREAVVEALLGLYREGNLSPSAEQIAGRAGISARSVFRYFDDTDDMVRVAIARQQAHLAPLYALDADPRMALPERVERFVAGRVRLLEGMGEVGRVARSFAVRQPLVLAELARIRGTLRRQLGDLFAAELDAMGSAERTATLAAADVVASWESFDLMRYDQGLGRDEAAAAMAAALLRLLDRGDGAAPGADPLMRASVRREVVVEAGADEAWNLVGRPEVLHTWFPGIVDCHVEGDTRVVTLGSGLTLDETILTNDPLQRRFQYRISGGLFTEHLASLDVIPLGERRCLVTYASDADPAALAIVLGGAMSGALAELRRQLERPDARPGDGPARPEGGDR